MRLKKLEMSGFKSFLDKTEILFPKGISAVVGPNGCGKSNVVDALRWVMGEQSVKQLRGQNREDIIFAGADGKKPVNLAEVSLLLENPDPVRDEEQPYKSFSEIMITRRLYRSGESLYMMNRQPCRLKDIHDLFMGSGTGRHSFAVIQQGNIGAITDAGPEERRIYLEEAADITRYKQRKKETLSRISDTKENLDRINDIIHELKRQITSLERQAKKAETFRKYRKRIRFLDIRIGIYRFENISKQISELQKKLEWLEAEEKETAVALGEAEAGFSELRTAHVGSRHRLEGLKEEAFEIRRTIDKAEGDTVHYQENLLKNGEELRKKLSDLEAVRERNLSIEREISQTEKNGEVVQAQVAALETELEAVVDRQASFRCEIASLESEIKVLNADHMKLASENARLGNALSNAEERKLSLKRQIRQRDEAIYIGRNDLERLAAEAAEKETALSEITIQLAGMEEERRLLENDIGDTKKAVAAAEEHYRDVDIEKGRLSAEYDTLNKMAKGFEWFNDGVRSVMAEFGAKNEKIIGVVSEILTPEPGYEKALAAALGDALQYLVVDTEASALDGIRFLNESDCGECGFMPEAFTVPVTEGGTAENELISYIRFSAENGPLIERLLAGVGVAETIESAIDQVKTTMHGNVVVTLQGEVVRPNGIITGGAGGKGAAILEKKKRMSELELKLNDLSEEIEKNDLIRQKKSADLERLRSDMTALSETINEAKQEKDAIEKQAYMASAGVEEARRRLEILALEKEKDEGELDDIDDEVEAGERSCQKIRAALSASEEAIGNAGIAIKEKSEAFEKENQGYVERKLSLTSLQAKADSHAATVATLKAYLDEGRLRFREIEAEIRENSELEKELTRRIADTREALANAGSRKTEVADSLTEARREHQKLEESIAVAEKDIRNLRAVGETCSEKTGEVRVLLSEERMKRESVTGRIEEKYHHRLNQHHLAFAEEGRSIDTLTEIDITGYETELTELNQKVRRMGDVNPGAISEFQELKTRYDFMVEQQADLKASIRDLEKIIERINTVSLKKFTETFDAVNQQLGGLFAKLFEGGRAELVLTNPENPLDSGVEMMIRPPGKTLTRLSLLSGGEKALSAIAFVFAVFLIRPSSFCIMDEIDAPLDDSNVVRFNNLLKVIGEQSQILIVTHNKLTMQFADILFGVTMEKKGVSRVVSVSLTEGKKVAEVTGEVA